MKFKTAGCMALALTISLAQYANAQDFLNLLQNYLSKGSGTGVAQSQDLIKTNINTRQAQLEADVAAGASSGQLTPQEETDLRNELNRIAAVEGTFLADANYSNAEVQSMLTELSNFSVKLQALLTNSTTGTNSTFNRAWFHKYGHGRFEGFPGNQTQFQSNIDTKQAQLDAMIDNGTTSGQLTFTEARNLRVQLNRVANDERTMLADGRLSYRESQQLITDLESLEARVNQQISDSQRRIAGRNRRGGRYINTRQTLLRQRIDRGLASGQLTRQEADRLRRDEQRLNTLELQLRTSGRGLSYTEERRLIAEVDQLSRKVDRELTDRQVQ